MKIFKGWISKMIRDFFFFFFFPDAESVYEWLKYFWARREEETMNEGDMARVSL